jgi:uncharacterized membrane protein YkoI
MKVMNITRVLGIILAAGWLVGCASTDYANNPEAHDKLHAEAKLDRDAAEKIALARVPGGTVQEAELEKERGRLIWSFEITTTGSDEVTEVEVDAKTGEVISTEKKKTKKDDEK